MDDLREKTHWLKRVLYAVSTLALVLVVAACVYLLYEVKSLRSEVAELAQGSASSTAADSVFMAEYATTSADITNKLVQLSDGLYRTQHRTEALEDRIGGVDQAFGDIEDSVATLRKIADTDPELLQKYSKVSFLNEHYAPARLTVIPEEYRYHTDRSERIESRVWPTLKKLVDEAKEDGVELFVKSAYRSFEEQRSLKSAYSVTYGAGTANQFSADQGYSEHQLGTTVDFITKGLDGSLAGFGGTPAYTWLNENAYRFGFILSYPEGNAYYQYEPWHWRYVGRDLARELHEDGSYFYSMEQRDIDEYLAELF